MSKSKDNPRFVQYPPDFRIYVIVATTVQVPLKLTSRGGFDSLDVTETITQPPGRIAAQVAHVVAKFRHNTILSHFKKNLLKSPNNDYYYEVTSGIFDGLIYQPVTTIVLGARDSLELQHVEGLLCKARIETYSFKDENDAVYGPGVKVKTALCTAPIDKEDSIGLIDYLPLYDPWKA